MVGRVSVRVCVCPYACWVLVCRCLDRAHPVAPPAPRSCSSVLSTVSPQACATFQGHHTHFVDEKAEAQVGGWFPAPRKQQSQTHDPKALRRSIWCQAVTLLLPSSKSRAPSSRLAGSPHTPEEKPSSSHSRPHLKALKQVPLS